MDRPVTQPTLAEHSSVAIDFSASVSISITGSRSELVTGNNGGSHQKSSMSIPTDPAATEPHAAAGVSGAAMAIVDLAQRWTLLEEGAHRERVLPMELQIFKRVSAFCNGSAAASARIAAKAHGCFCEQIFLAAAQCITLHPVD